MVAKPRLVARLDLKAERRAGRLRVVSAHYEAPEDPRRAVAATSATRVALVRLAESLNLKPVGLR